MELIPARRLVDDGGILDSFSLQWASQPPLVVMMSCAFG
jgi:hypothetical protein